MKAEVQDSEVVRLHKPEVIVYDLPRPYESHWNFLRLLKETDSLTSVVEDDIQEGAVNLQATVVFNEAELSELVHEETHP